MNKLLFFPISLENSLIASRKGKLSISPTVPPISQITKSSFFISWDINFFIKKSSELLKKNGLMFIATLNKTLKSYMFAIVGAEYIFKWLPIGTHDWNKFIKPDELIKIAKINNLKLEKLDGINFDLLANEWNLSSNNSVNYIAKFKKNS